MENIYLIGLIGNIGSGKSTVRKMLEQHGARGLDADALAHVIMQRGTPTWRALVETFGAEILTHNGRINRRALGARVFADPDALKKLETLTHPAVRALTKQILRDTPQPVAVIEAIKLVEAGMHYGCDALWAVTCAPEIAIARIRASRGLSDSDARARLAAQGSLDSKLALANVVIDNSGDEAATVAQVEREWQAIQLGTARNKRDWFFASDVNIPVASPQRIEMPPAPIAQPSQPAQMVTPAFTNETQLPLETIKTSRVFETRRTRRSDLATLAVAIAQREHRSQPLSHEESLKRFGERGYRIALADGRIVAFAAWEAENLVATVREIWAESADAAPALPKLVALIEDEARALLCEVALLLIEADAPTFVLEHVRAAGYLPQELQALHPLWRQVAHDRLQAGQVIWSKRLREDLLTKPF